MRNHFHNLFNSDNLKVILEKFQVIVFMNNAKNDNLELRLENRNFEMILRCSKFRENLKSVVKSYLCQKLLRKYA